MSISMFKLHRFLAVILVTGIVAVNIFAIGPVILLLPALYIALSPPSVTEEVKGRGFLMNFGLFLATFGAYGLVFPFRDIVVDEIRFISLDPLDRFSAIGKSLKSAVEAYGDGAANLPFIDTLQFLSVVEYASYWGLILATFFGVLTAPAVRGAVGRRLMVFQIKVLLNGKYAFPQWIAGLILMAISWAGMYLLNFDTTDLGGKGWVVLYLSPVSGAIFMIGAVLTGVHLRMIVAQYRIGPVRYLAIGGVTERAPDLSAVRRERRGQTEKGRSMLRSKTSKSPGAATSDSDSFHQIPAEW